MLTFNFLSRPANANMGIVHVHVHVHISNNQIQNIYNLQSIFTKYM